MKTRVIVTLCLALLSLGAGATRGEEGTYPRRSYTTRATDTPPKLDGRLDDPCWNSVEWATDFVQWEPAEGQAPTYQTAFKILYDHHNLYVAYRAFDADPDHISSILARRDGFPGDWVEINIDSYNDHRTAFSFTSSVSGVRGDEFISSDGDNWDGNWDPIWDLHTAVDAQGWTAEVRIPLSQLRFADREEQVWGFQVQRRLFRKEERSIWQPKSKKESGWVSRFGELRGITGIHSQRQVELMPYSVGKGESFAKVPGDPFLDGASGALQLGLDGKVGVHSNMTLDFTVNPDFGQVEADPSEVNLSAFETRFAEKRPFFIEGQSILDFQLAPSVAGGSFTSDNLFYTRRIGRRPRRSLDLADGEYADMPTATSIVAASKLTGRTAKGLSVGVLESVTAKEEARIQTGPLQHEEEVEPRTNFFVGRLQQDLQGGNLQLGAMATAVNRRIDSPGLEFLHRAAYAGGVDFVSQWRNKKWYVAGTAEASQVEGTREAMLATQTASARYFQRPDNGHESVDSTRTSLAGHAGSVRFGRAGGSNLRFETGTAWRSPGFEINDAGFMRRADEINQFGWMGYSIRNPFSIFRSLGANVNQWLDWDFGGTNLDKQGNVNFNANFKNNWSCGAGTTRTWDRISNTALRGGPSFRAPSQWNEWFWADTDSRKRVYSSFGGNWSDGENNNNRFRNGWVDLSYRPSNALRLTLSPSYSKSRDQLQYVTTVSSAFGDRYLFGRIDEKTAALTLRLDYTIRPNLTLQFYGAPFVAAGSYGAFKRITQPRAERYAERFHTYAGSEIRYDAGADSYGVDENGDHIVDYSFGKPDFNVRDFNSNLVARWEFQPGSVMYLVWSQGRSDFAPNGDFALGHDFRGLFDAHSHDVFLLKVSKWLSL